MSDATDPADRLAAVVDIGELDGYESLVPIGRGGLGDVYRAVQTSSGASVAIKVLRDVSDSSAAWHRTRRELTALLALSGHANVVQIVELLELEEGPALVMEYASGGSIAELVRARGGTLSVDETVFVGRQVASALAAAHVRGIVHRDVKPQNLLIDGDGQVQLCDFGIASLTRDAEYRGRTNAISVRYASPEDLEHDADVGPPSDVYSLGATLLHLARGEPPTLKERLAPWEPPFATDARLAALDRVIARCLHPSPAMRPTAQALVDALDGQALGAGTDRVVALAALHQGGPALTRPEGWSDTSREWAPGADPDAPTVQHPLAATDRPADRAADPPRPSPRRRGHGALGAPSTVVAAALAVVIGVAIAIVVWPADDLAAPAPSDATAGDALTNPVAGAPSADSAGGGPIVSNPPPSPLVTAVRPGGLPDLAADAVGWGAGAMGDCLAQHASASELTVVACDRPHDLQRYAIGSLVDLGVTEPFVPASVAETVTDACRSAFAGFVGRTEIGSGLRIAQTQPSAAGWAAGDRTYHCYVGVPGARLVGDAAGSEW